MTPYSAIAGCSRSSRASSRSTCLRTTSGSSSASSCERSSFTSAWTSSASPSSSWIALSCWRRKYSRWPLSSSDWTWDWIFDPIATTSSSRARISDRRRRRLETSTSSSNSCFSSVGIRSAPAIRWVSTLGSSTLATMIWSSSGRYGTCSMISVNVCWTLRISAVSSGVCWTTSGISSISATRYGSVLTQRTSRIRWPPWISTRSVPSGTRIIRATVPSTPTS